MPGAARRLLADMGLLEGFLQDGHLPRYALRGVWGEAEPIERDVLRDPDGCGWTLDRVRFERRLRAVAGARGATLWAPARLLSLSRDGEKWRAEILHEGDSKPLRARMILDAGGRTSKALARQGAKRVHGDRLICLSARSRRARLPPAVTHIEAEADGWWYAAPLPDGGAVLAFHTDSDLPAARACRTGAALFDRAKRLPALASCLDGFATQSMAFRACGAQSARLEPCAGDGWIACGDAALAFDPLSSQGLFNALYTGLAAAETSARILTGDENAKPEYLQEIDSIHAAYRRQLSDWYGLERRWSDHLFWRRRQVGELDV